MMHSGPKDVVLEPNIENPHKRRCGPDSLAINIRTSVGPFLLSIARSSKVHGGSL